MKVILIIIGCLVLAALIFGLWPVFLVLGILWIINEFSKDFI